MREFLASVLAVLSTLLVVLVLVAFGWYLVWKFFLLRFKFVQELFLSSPSTSSSSSSSDVGTSDPNMTPRGRKRPVRKD